MSLREHARGGLAGLAICIALPVAVASIADAATGRPDSPGFENPVVGQAVSGWGQPGTSVSVSVSGSDTGRELCTATVSADHSWSCQPDRPLVVVGEYLIATQPVDGISSNASAPQPVTDGR